MPLITLRGPLLACALAVLAGSATAETFSRDAGTPTFVWVLDAEGEALVHLVLPAGERLAELRIEGKPEFLLESPDGSRLVILDRGPGEDAGDRGYKPKGRSRATIVDPALRSIVGSVDLGSGVDLSAHYFGPEGRRLTLLCPGYAHGNPEDARPRELVNIDVLTGQEIGRVTLEHGTEPVGFDGEALSLMQGRPPGGPPPHGQGRLWVVDLGGPTILGKVDTSGYAQADWDASHVKLLHLGRPNDNPRRNRNGTLLLYSIERRKLEWGLDVGRNPRAYFPDEPNGQVFVASDAPPELKDDDSGRLHAVRGSEVAAILEVAANPKRVIRAGDSILVIGEKALTLIDPVALEVTGTIPLRVGRHDLVDDDEIPTDFELTSDGRRAVILYGLKGQVATIDLENETALGAPKMGSSRGTLLTLASVGLTFAPGGDWWLTAAGLGLSIANKHWNYNEPVPDVLTTREDGGFAYAINGPTRDVMAIDMSTGRGARKTGAKGDDLLIMPGGASLAVLSGGGVQIVDTTTNEKVREIKVPALAAFRPAPTGDSVVALGKGVVVFLDGTTGEEVSRVDGWKTPVALSFAGREPPLEYDATPAPDGVARDGE